MHVGMHTWHVHTHMHMDMLTNMHKYMDTHTAIWKTSTLGVCHLANCAVKPSVSEERKGMRKDLNQDHINKPVAGREKP